MGFPVEEPTSEPNDDKRSGAAADVVGGQRDRDEELTRLEDRWRRSVADLDNLRKRYARELDRERSMERARVAAAWLPVVDNLERAISHAGEESSAVLDGVRNTVCEAMQVLDRLGYPRDAQAGVPFDPERHEVVGVLERPDSTPGTVLEVLRPGYGGVSGQLRPAAVVVSRREE